MKRATSLLTIVLLAIWTSSASAEMFWEFHTVDSPTGSFNNVGFYNSLALDTEGRPHVTYMKDVFAEPDLLRYAVLNGATWDIQTVDIGSATGSLTVGTLALDGDDRPHISYGDGAAFKLAVLDEDAWGVTTFGDEDRTNYGGNSLTLDATGTPHVSFKFDYTPESDFPNHSGLGYATIDGANWTPTTIEATDEHGGLGQASRLALDADGLGHVVYRGDLWEVKYAGQLSDGTIWIPEVVADDFAAAHTSSLALDSQNRPHITLRTFDGITYAFHDGDTWQFHVLDETPGIISSSVVIDDQELPHIAYTRPNMPDVTAGLLYAHYDGQSWHTELVRTGQSLDVGSLALDANGMPHISFHDFTFGRNLQYAVLVPEPTSLTLLGLVGALLFTSRRRRG